MANNTIVIGGGIPENIKWHDNVQVHDIGIKLHYLREKQPVWLSVFLWFAKAILAQFLMAWYVVRLASDIDIIFCFTGVYYQIPILVGKILGKKILSASWGIYSLKAKINYGRFAEMIIRFLSWISFSLSDVVLVDSLRNAYHPDLIPFRSKIYNGAKFLEDMEMFQVRTPLHEREDLVAFIGRLVEEKGVLEFARAVPLILEKQPHLHFLIIGTGRLDEALDGAVQDQPWSSHITRVKWVDHEQMPPVLNKIKLLVVPSLDEGLPNIILEAMGCGTPVLGTPVGGIPDLIVNNETGFLLENNSPDEIAKGVIQAINDPNLEAITKSARILVEENYSYRAACERYEIIINSVS